jgi:hypothetical protein
MTNILLLPSFGPGTAFTISRNGDWNDALYISQPNAPASPLDLTGITFTSELRSKVGAVEVMLLMSTVNGLIMNGGTAGTFGFDVPQMTIERMLAAGSYVIDIVATADGRVFSMFPEGPGTVTVTQGITDPP